MKEKKNLMKRRKFLGTAEMLGAAGLVGAGTVLLGRKNNLDNLDPINKPIAFEKQEEIEDLQEPQLDDVPIIKTPFDKIRENPSLVKESEILRATSGRFGIPTKYVSMLEPYTGEVFGFPLVGKNGYQVSSQDWGTDYWEAMGKTTTLAHGIELLTKLDLYFKEDLDEIQKYVSWYINFRDGVEIEPSNIYVHKASGLADVKVKERTDKTGKELSDKIATRDTNHILVPTNKKIWVPKNLLKE